MANVKYEDYINAQNRSTNSNDFAKVGYFKKLKDGDFAIVKLNIASFDDIKIESVHGHKFGSAGFGLKTYAGISCLGGADKCPFCKAAAEHPVIDVAKKKMYVQMMVRYPQGGTFTDAEPVVWERPAGFAKDVAAKLKDWGDLRSVAFKLTRIGSSASDTRYTLDIVPPVYKVVADGIPEDFAAFANHDPAKHDYYVKTAEEMMTFINEGAFAEAITEAAPVVEEEAAPCPWDIDPNATAATAAPISSIEPEAVKSPLEAQVDAVLAAQTAKVTPSEDRPARTVKTGGFNFSF